jgi:hypothetical protein
MPPGGGPLPQIADLMLWMLLLAAGACRCSKKRLLWTKIAGMCRFSCQYL